MGNSNFGKKGAGGLYVDLVPQTAWCSNLRTLLPQRVWKQISSCVAAHASHKCEICEGAGSTHPVEAHERWEFNPVTRTQTLIGIESLCPRCHRATHFGFAQSIGRGPEAFKRLCYVNGWDDETTRRHIEFAFAAWQQLSQIPKWKLDLSWLELNSGSRLDESAHTAVITALQGLYESKSNRAA